jgi:hypothetical protein
MGQMVGMVENMLGMPRLECGDYAVAREAKPNSAEL